MFLKLPFERNEAAQQARLPRQSLILLNFFILRSILHSDESFSNLSEAKVFTRKD